jgi:uncharacterized phage-associated protein
VFDAFKIYGDGPIAAPALYLDYASDRRIPVPHDDIAAADMEIIDREFGKYSRFSTGHLVSLSHEPGGPWDIVYRANLADKTQSPRISNKLIRSYFAGETKSTIRH